LRRNCGTFVFPWINGSVGERLRGGTRPLLCLSDHDLAPVSRVWGGLIQAWLGNVRAFEHRRRTSALVCGSLIESFGNAQSGIIDPAAWMRCDVCSVFAKLAATAGRKDSLKYQPHRISCRYFFAGGPGLCTDESCRQPGESHKPVERKERFGESYRRPFAWSGSEDKTSKEAQAIEPSFAELQHQSKISE